ncbi:eCIS core domain-containing protein [Aureibacter tunicatorum]|uniref:eCIS core domain-containing protein n=1 Tax=Aureibacter tunicatorum TaxID=866807 RepID=A0AAE4BR43_9BACT|nr:DUF4157 domain-containing protein [Aureibacter tunicatorum]MDR6237370.1 hypothetical protein [Aureibacter tunicatorum]BDD06361.1 hypothetical protein AUTU_38440 [Aureibacter tunicatorum]
MEKRDQNSYQNNFNKLAQMKADQKMKENWQAVQRKKTETDYSRDSQDLDTVQRKEENYFNTPAIQRQENNQTSQQQSNGSSTSQGGLPKQLKSGIESLSGQSMNDVKVHYNSDKPAQLQAHAFAQGNDIHLASGQEKHLPHEAWHVVQQKEGRVKPTRQMKGKVNINDDAGLEREADLMGAKAMSEGSKATNTQTNTAQLASNDSSTVQRRAFLDRTNSTVEMVTEDQGTKKDVVYHGPMSLFYSVGRDGALQERTDLEDDQDFKYQYETTDAWIPQEDLIGYKNLKRVLLLDPDFRNVSLPALRESIDHLFVDEDKKEELYQLLNKDNQGLQLSETQFVKTMLSRMSFQFMNELHSKYIVSGESGVIDEMKKEVQKHNSNDSNEHIEIDNELSDWEYLSASLTALLGQSKYENAMAKICDGVATYMMGMYGEGGLEAYDGLVNKLNTNSNEQNNNGRVLKTTNGYEFHGLMRDVIKSKSNQIAQIKISANGLPHTFAIAANEAWSTPAFIQAYEGHITLDEHVSSIGVFNYDAMSDIVVPLAECLNTGTKMSGAVYNSLFGGPSKDDVKISEILVIVMPMVEKELDDVGNFSPQSGYMKLTPK